MIKVENDLISKKRERDSKLNKKQSKRITLTKQLEFYFSDLNLLNDKFLKDLIKRDNEKGVKLTIIETFNKVKELLEDVDNPKEKNDYIKKAVLKSNKIRLNIRQDKVIRVTEFNENKLNKKLIDERSIYVENLPNDITHEILTSIFSKIGKVELVSIPKFEDKTAKGFAFITFSVNYLYLFYLKG